MSGGIKLSEIMGRVPRMRKHAHEPRNFIDCTLDPPDSLYLKTGLVLDEDEEWVDHQPLLDELRFTVKEGAHWETKLTFCYTVDVVVLKRRVARMKHLSVQMSVPGQLTRGQLNAGGAEEFLQQLEPIIKLFFPLTPEVATAAPRALDPIPVARDEDNMKRGNVVFRTPILFDFFVDHDDPSRLFREQQAQAKPKVQLYGPRGEKL